MNAECAAEWHEFQLFIVPMPNFCQMGWGNAKYLPTVLFGIMDVVL